MRLPLWILNSSLFVIFIVMLLINIMLRQQPPVLRIKQIIAEPEKKKSEIFVNLERIYKQDIFDTYIPLEQKPIKQSLITPIPEPRPVVFTPPPEPKKPEFIDPLNVKLKGIISSENDQKSIAMIADEADKEKIYHLGDRVKDGQIIKIEKNKIVILRANGQQEIFLLRKDEDFDRISTEKWKFVVKKIDDFNYEIDPKEFSKEAESIGNLIETLSLSTSYKNGKAIGIKVGKVDANEIGSIMGLAQNDIIIAINNIKTTSTKNRVKIYDEISRMDKGDSLNILLNRNNADTILKYKLVKIEKPLKKMFTDPATETPGAPPAPQTQLQAGPEQEREKKIKEFEEQHKESKHPEIISDIRRRLLENMKKLREQKQW